MTNKVRVITSTSRVSDSEYRINGDVRKNQAARSSSPQSAVESATTNSSLQKKTAYQMPQQEDNGKSVIKAPKPDSLSRMNRSKFVVVDGIAYWTRATPFRIKESEKDIIHVVSDGERIDQIALRYYNNEKLWWVIAEANGITLIPVTLKVGSSIVIPDITNIRMDLAKKNETSSQKTTVKVNSSGIKKVQN